MIQKQKGFSAPVLALSVWTAALAEEMQTGISPSFFPQTMWRTGSGEVQRNPVRRRKPPAGRKGIF